MTRADVHTLVGAYILDALDSAERALVDEHLAACEACTEEVAELRSVTSRLAADVATAPPAALRGSVLNEVARTPQFATEPAADSVRRSARPLFGPRTRQTGRDRRRLGGKGLFVGVAAALAALCLSLGFVVADQRAELDATRARATALSELASAAIEGPGASAVADGGRIAVVGAGEQALLVARDLPELPDGRTYQLWLIDDDSIRSAGLVDDNRDDRGGGAGDGRARDDDRLVSVAGVRPGDTELAVTVEPDGGSAQPTTPILASVPLRA